LVKAFLSRHYREYLKKKWSWKRFRKVVPKAPDPVEYEKKKRNLEFLMLLFLTGGIDLRFGDETGFNLEPNVPYGWSKKGEQVGIPSKKGGNLNVFGLLNVAGELTSFVTTKTINSKTIIDCLDEFVETIEKTTVVVLDNAPWHISKEVVEKIEQWEKKGLLIFYLPTYSPHLNLIETLWRKIKIEWLKPKDFKSKEDLHEAIKCILKNYGSQEYDINFNVEKCYNNYG
jgi:transposase